jgi:DNA helicase-2/ATP-dependent DNA helicase PcrA
MTRARKKLHLLYAKNRTVFGNTQFRVMSRFVEEVPPEYLELRKADYFARRTSFIERPGLSKWKQHDEFSQVSNEGEDYTQITGITTPFPKGSRVHHPVFGEGVVRNTVGADKLIVEFKGRGLKKISLKFSQLQAL